MANKHVVNSHFKEEYMHPLQPFAMRHVHEIQVGIFSQLSECCITEIIILLVYEVVRIYS